MPENPAPSVNSWLEDELYQQYLHDRKAVDSGWTQVFESNGHSADPQQTAVIETRKPEPPAVAPGDQLVDIFKTRAEKVVFVKGDKDLDFGTIAQVIGMGHQADVTNIGIITPQVEAGH